MVVESSRCCAAGGVSVAFRVRARRDWTSISFVVYCSQELIVSGRAPGAFQRSRSRGIAQAITTQLFLAGDNFQVRVVNDLYAIPRH